MRIRTFFVVVLLVALVPLLILDIFNYRTSLFERRQIILNRNLEIANTVAVGFEHFLLEAVNPEEAAGLAILQGVFSDDEIETYLPELRARNPHLSSLSYAAPGGRILATTGRRNPIPRQNIESIRRGRDWAVSALHRSPGDFRAEFHVTAAVRTGGRVRALVDGVIGDRQVFDFIKIRIGRRGNIGIIDNHGRAVALSFKRDLTWAQRDRTFIKSIRTALKGKPATTTGFHDPLGDVDRMGASVPIQGLGWVANVFQPVEEVLGPVRRDALAEAIRFSAISIVVLGVVLILSAVITRPITELAAATEHFRRGRYAYRVPTRSRVVEIRALAEAMNAAAEETQKRYEAEQHIADTLQAALLPVEPPQLPGFDIGTRYASATERALVGGDFYDFIVLGPERAGIVIGDVQGKGIDAAVITVMIKFAVRDLAARRPSPADVLKIVNHICQRELAQDQFITIVYLVLNLRTGELEYGGAGHHPPIICGGAGCRELTENGPALGIFDDVDYRSGRDRLKPDETLVLYTDGIVEARSDAELFGLERLSRAVTRSHDSPAQLICELVYRDCVDFSGGKLRDDLALVVIKRTGSD